LYWESSLFSAIIRALEAREMSLKQAIVVRSDLKMGKGKIAAQASHASVAVLNELLPSVFGKWNADGMKKIVLKVGSEQELLDLYKRAKKNFAVSIVRDAGFTQVEKGSITCIAIGPAEEREIDRITGKLWLL
jgi:PTH2 family peptidyl-tRNA hydrolase